MKLVIDIELSNEAFQPNPAPEVSRILEFLAHRIEAFGLRPVGAGYMLHDINGNFVGYAKCEE